MKKSEELKLQASIEDNDLKAMGIIKKANRAKRHEKFEEETLPKLLKSEYVTEVIFHEDQIKYEIRTVFETDSIIDFYPKSDKILFRKRNQWKRNGWYWILSNLINK